MKKMRKIMSLLLAMIMVFAMTTTAFAEEAEPTRTYKYEIYQIFTGEFHDGILSNVALGTNGQAANLEAALAELEAVPSDASNQAKLDVITKYVNSDSTPTLLETDQNPAKKEGLTDGYYLVKDVANSQEGNKESYTTFVVEVVDGTLVINRKDGVPEVDKDILDPHEMKANEASIGDKVNYQITGTLPTNIADYKEYYYVFTDTLSKGLTYNNDAKVTVNGVDVTKYFYISPSEYSETNGTTIIAGMQDLLALENSTDPVVGEITADTTVVITYSATLNENAVIADVGNPNVVDLTYYNNPNQSGDGTPDVPPTPPQEEPETENPTGVTPPSTVVTFTTELTILKTDEEGNVLTGAEFTLTTENGAKVLLITEEKFVEAADGEYYKLADETFTKQAPTDETADKYADTEKTYKRVVEIIKKGENTEFPNLVGTVDEEGKVTFTGLGVGKYTITETKVPAGYNEIEPIEFTLTFDYETKTFVSNNKDVVVGADNKLDTTIVNEKGTVLPETGGIGTTIFYAIGAVLVLGAAVTLITRKRMSK